MIEIRIRCDKCETALLWEFSVCDYYLTKQDLIRTARYLGFAVGKKILCPDCNGKLNPHKEVYELLKMKGRERK